MRVWALALLHSWNQGLGVSPCCPDPGNEVFQVETGAESSVTGWGLMERQGNDFSGENKIWECGIWAVLKGRSPSQLLKSEISCISKLSTLLGGGGGETNSFSGKVFVLPLSSWVNNLLEVSVSIHLLSQDTSDCSAWTLTLLNSRIRCHCWIRKERKFLQ